MRNIFKPMAVAALFCAAAFAPGLTAYAQNLDEGTYEEKNGIAYRKSATLVNGTTDEYWIELEAFVTGDVKVVTGYKPVDIAMVLDKSGSMEEAVPNTYIQESHFNYAYVNRKKSPLFDINDSDNKNYNYYYKDGDAYYKIEAYTGDFRDTPSGDRVTRYILQYKKNGTNYLIGPEGPVQANATYDYTSQITVWTNEGKTCSFTKAQQGNYATKEWFPNDNVYRNKSRIEVLKDAVKSFVQKVAYYDTHDSEGNTVASVGHQVAIVSFSNDSTTTHPFIGVSDTNVAKINNAIDGIETSGFTQTDLGVQRAVELINEQPDDRDEASKVIVVFTDGNPGSSTTFDTTIASNAIGYARSFKATGKVYTIGMINNPSDNAQNFLNYLSSNYPNAASMTSPGAVDSEGNYYQLATGSDLTNIFESIAEHAASTAGNTEVTAESAVTVDVVTTSFNIPKTAGDTYDIQVLVAACNGQSDRINPKTGKNYLTFAAPVSPEAAGFEITLDPDALDDNEVVTRGFDYSANFCAYNAEANPPARGYKQIIRFRIKANEDAVGGPDVLTNEESSGIYINDPDNPGQTKQIAVFNRPTVKVPVQIWIAKQGLLGSDNAVFTIYYADPKAAANVGKGVADYSWTHFTKVSINNDLPLKYDNGGTQIPMVKVVGLDPDYVYKIKEDAWGWSYTPVVGTMYTAPVKETDIISNPFIFINVPKDNLKEDVDVVRNIFNPGSVPPSSGE